MTCAVALGTFAARVDCSKRVPAFLESTFLRDCQATFAYRYNQVSLTMQSTSEERLLRPYVGLVHDPTWWWIF